MIKIFLRLAIYGLITGIIFALPWPEIPDEVFASINKILFQIWQFNTWVPIDTIFQLAFIVISIEFFLFTFELLGKIINFFTGGNDNIASSFTDRKL